MAKVFTTFVSPHQSGIGVGVVPQSLAGKIKGGQVPDQEIIAELTAATLASLYCPEANLGFSYEYVEAYAQKSKKTVERACIAVINTVGLVLDEIMGILRQDESQAA